jgi:hypothetical protein
MIYELRVYRVVQGRMAALLTRFEHQTLPIMVRHQCSSLGPSPRLLHGSPDAGSSLGRAGIAGKVIVFKDTSDSVLGHAIGKSGDTVNCTYLSVSELAIWHSSRLNNCLTRLTQEKRVSSYPSAEGNG